MSKVEVRRANGNDIPDFKRIIANSNAISGHLYTASLPLSSNYSVVHERQVVFAAIINTEVIGFLNLHWNNPISKAKQEAEFEVVVDPGFRLSGAGGELLFEAIKHITENTKIATIIAKIKHGNQGSEKLCENLGFTKAHQDNLGAYWELNIER